jgi:lysyl-tRNA synthetase class 2
MGGLFRAESQLGPVQRAEVRVLRRLSPFFQIESLHRFNSKFLPEWIPRYIYYEPPLSLPRVALAYLETEAFLNVPLIGSRARTRHGRSNAIAPLGSRRARA